MSPFPGRPARGALLTLLVLWASEARAVSDPSDLTRLSIEELALIRVVTVSKRPQTQREVPGAVYVVTPEDIRRTGATTLPDALRLAPGLQASRIDANEWALTIRGFANRLSRSTLVLVDGRSLWTPLFAGVFWDAQDVFLEDVDRIEVSRGPGGASYGANAMNGVINVITKPARDTVGGLLTAGGGADEAFAGARWGGALRPNVHYRLYGKFSDRDGTRALSPDTGYDDEARAVQGGFRVDWETAGKERFTLHGDAYRGTFGERVLVSSFTPPYSTSLEGDGRLNGANVVAGWQHPTAGGGDIRAQIYYDRTSRDEVHFDEQRDTFDVELQQRLAWGSRNELVWGANYRTSKGNFTGVPTLQLVPARRTDDIAGVFVNNEARLLNGRLRLTFGSKLEWNDYSGWNVQPSARIGWNMGSRTVWAAVTRSVRTSSRIERDILLYSSLSPTAPLFARAQGSEDFKPESVVAVEGGFKAQVSPHVYWTASTFYNFMDDLATNEPGPPTVEAGPPSRTVVPVRFANGQEGRSYGVESALIASLSRAVRLRASYSFVSIDQRTKEGSADVNEGFEGNTPRHQLWLSAYVTPFADADADFVVRHVGPVPTHKVTAYTELDARIAYRPMASLELAVLGKNLLHAGHVEFGGGFEIERNVLAQATIRW